MQLKTLMAAGIAVAALAGCADDYAYRSTAATPTTTTTTVTRDYWGNPVGQSTVVRDAYGNPIATGGGAYVSPPVYSGSSMPPPAGVYSGSSAPIMVREETERQRAIRAAQHPECRATALHQDRPGGSNYDPARGAPSCIDLLGR